MDSPSATLLPSLAPSGSTSYAQPELSPNQAPFTDAQVEEYREQDRWLPILTEQIANVARIMKNSLPSNAKISKEAKECVQECVSEFISFITSEAADKCINEKRKTINGEDILTSMRTLGFDNYESVLKIYLAKYREHQLTHGQKRPGEVDDEIGEDGKRKRKRSGTVKRKGTQNSVASLEGS